VVYVPTYNPTTTYGTWAYPASPPVYYPPPPAYYPGSALVAGLAFGTGVAIVASLWGNCDWGNNDVDIDVNRYNNINGNNRITNNQNKWQHNTAHRDGVPYRDNRSREQYGRQLNGANQREAYRGDNAQRAQAREKARGSMDRHGIERPATSNREARDQARAAQSGPSASNRMQAGTDRPRASDRSPGHCQEHSGQSARPGQVNQRGRALAGAPDSAKPTGRQCGQCSQQCIRRRALTVQTNMHKPVVAGPARHPPSAPVPRDQPATRSVGRPVRQRVKEGGAVVE
jgi:hypothetical protein